MNNNKELDSFGLAGAILNIVVGGIESVASVIFMISGIIIFWDDSIGLLYFIIGLLIGSIAIISLVFNAKFISGEYKYKKEASVMGFISLSVLGSVLLTISKLEVKESASLLNDLKRAKELLDAKVINEEEYVELKRKIIFKD